VLVPVLSATGLVLATVFVHAGATLLSLGWLRASTRPPRRHTPRSRVGVLGSVVVVMAFAALVEAGVWAGFYLWMGALASFEEALYFSLVSFTTLGYGDVTLVTGWRLLAAFEAANGIILFGWTTALIVAVAQRLFAREGEDER
jgi:hypothetical protein